MINICWAPREVLNPEPERRGFQHLPRGQQMLIYQKTKFDRYYCIKKTKKKNKKQKKTFFSLENFGKIASNSYFYLYL